MKKLFAAILLSVAAVGQAAAADLAPVVRAPMPASYDWSGFYVGAHAGGGWQSTSFADPDAYSNLINCCIFIGATNLGTAPGKDTSSSFLGGAQVGWMYQIGRLVVGSDFDWSATHLSGGANGVSFPTITGTSFANETYSVNTKWTATSTATVGIARDRWMLYSKAGVAAADSTYGLNIAGAGGGVPFSFGSSTSNTVIGWTVGTGVKWAFAQNWFANVEYDYLDFGSKAQNMNGVFTATPAFFAGSPAATFNPTFNQHISEVKVGLNYKFSPGFLFW
jgi:outer membrane immunogenic protein